MLIKFNGQISLVLPNQPIAEKNNAKDTPIQISGITMGNETKPSTKGLNGKRKRHSSMAVQVPRMTLTMVAITAMVSVLPKASIRSSLLNALP